MKYTYDSNDAFFIAGSAVTYAAFDYRNSLVSSTNLVIAVDDLFDGTNNGKLATDGVAGNASEFRLVD